MLKIYGRSLCPTALQWPTTTTTQYIKLHNARSFRPLPTDSVGRHERCISRCFQLVQMLATLARGLIGPFLLTATPLVQPVLGARRIKLVKIVHTFAATIHVI